MSTNIHVIGGATGIGKWLINNIFSSLPESYNIFCYDINHNALAKGTYPENVKRCPVDSTNRYDNHRENFQRGDFIILSVPEKYIEISIRELLNVSKESSVFITATSVQQKPLQIMSHYLQSSSLYFGCHLLFSPQVQRPAGQTFVLVQFDENKTKHREFRQVFLDRGLIPVILTAEEHDQCMAFVQALTHFCFIGFVCSLLKGPISLDKLMKLRTPNFQFLLAFASRVIKLSPDTTGSIQSTYGASAARRKFIDVLTELHGELDAASKISTCASVIERMREPLTGSCVDEGIAIAAVAVDSITRFEDLLHRYKESGEMFVFVHRLHGSFHAVRIKSIYSEVVTYEESTRMQINKHRKYFAIGINDIARKNYRRYGINLRRPVEAKIRKRNIRLLAVDDLVDFRKNKILPIFVELSVKNVYNLSIEYLERELTALIKELWHCEFMDSYRTREMMERIRFLLTVDPNSNVEEVLLKVRRAVEERQLTDTRDIQLYT